MENNLQSYKWCIDYSQREGEPIHPLFFKTLHEAIIFNHENTPAGIIKRITKLEAEEIDINSVGE